MCVCVCVCVCVCLRACVSVSRHAPRGRACIAVRAAARAAAALHSAQRGGAAAARYHSLPSRLGAPREGPDLSVEGAERGVAGRRVSPCKISGSSCTVDPRVK